MPLLILFILVAAPLVEIYILIEVGAVIGGLSTIGLCLLTAAVGGLLLRQQGLRTVQRARNNLDRGSLPAIELLEGVLLAIGAVFLLTPGFVTDVLGFACVVPVTRQWLVGMLMERLRIRYAPVEGQAEPQHRPQAGSPPPIEGQWEHRDRPPE